MIQTKHNFATPEPYRQHAAIRDFNTALVMDMIHQDQMRRLTSPVSPRSPLHRAQTAIRQGKGLEGTGGGVNRRHNPQVGGVGIVHKVERIIYGIYELWTQKVDRRILTMKLTTRRVVSR